MKQTLLEQAKEYKGHHRKVNYSEEEIDLAVAWVRGEISYNQVQQVTRKFGSNLYNFLAIALREAYKKGK